MSMERQHLLHYKSTNIDTQNTCPVAPSPMELYEGEIAINYAKGHETLFIKNNNDEIVFFKPSNILETFSTDVITLLPNRYYRKTNKSTSLTIYLETESDANVLNEYFIEFTTSDGGTTISLPSVIMWQNGEVPTFEANTTYQISIVNNLGICVKFK